MKKYFVYVDVRSDGAPFYVGKGDMKRAQDFTRNAWHTSIRKKDCGWDRVIVFESYSEEATLAREVEIIKHFGRRNIGRGTLVNFTDGGDGVSGLVHSEATKKKLSSAGLGELNHNYGKPKTNEIKSKISASNKASYTSERRMAARNRGLGKEHSAETRAKIGAAFKGVKQSAENIQKRKEGFTPDKRARMAERVKASLTPERLLAMSVAMRGRKHTDEARAKITAAQTGAKRTEEAKANMAEAQRLRNASNPVSDATRERLSLAARNRSPEQKARTAKSVSALMTPEHRAHLAKKNKEFHLLRNVYLTATMSNIPHDKVTRKMIDDFTRRAA